MVGLFGCYVILWQRSHQKLLNRGEYEQNNGLARLTWEQWAWKVEKLEAEQTFRR